MTSANERLLGGTIVGRIAPIETELAIGKELLGIGYL